MHIFVACKKLYPLKNGYMKKSILILLTCLLCALSVNAQEHIEKKYTLFFRVGKSEIDKSYKNNGKTIETMLNDIKTTLEVDGTVPENILIYASTSPEGGIEINNRLAAERSKYSKKLLMDFFPQFKEENIKVEARMNDWSGVILVLRRDSSIQFRDEIINVIANPNIKNKEAVLRSKPEIFNVLKDVMFDNMRTASITISVVRTETNVDEFVEAPELYITSQTPIRIPAEGGVTTITFDKNNDDTTAPAASSAAEWIGSILPDSKKVTFNAQPNTVTAERTSTIKLKYYEKTYDVTVIQEAAQPIIVEPEPQPEPEPLPVVEEPKEKKPWYMAIKTNMLYDVALVPNVGVEVYLGKNISVVGNWMYSWWKSDKKSWYWRTYGGDLAVRYWLGQAAQNKPLTGHHLGLYGQILTYDFEVGNRGYLADKWTYGGGLEYGYALPIARRLNIDFTLGVGYLGGEVKEYLPIDGHYVWQLTKQRQWFGPTKLEISLSWLIGRGNINKDKGGKR